MGKRCKPRTDNRKLGDVLFRAGVRHVIVKKQGKLIAVPRTGQAAGRPTNGVTASDFA